MRKYNYNFDWQENKGYEEIVALNKQSKAKSEVESGECLPKKRNSKNFGKNNINK